MAVFKCTMVFKMATDPLGTDEPGRTGGWTESWYFEGDLTAAVQQFTGGVGLCKVRATFLPGTASISGQRYQQVSPTVGASITRGKEFRGNPLLQTDMPQVSLLTTLPGAGVSNVRHHIFRCIPDEMVILGEYSPTAQFRQFVGTMFQALGQWKFRGLDLSIARIPIVSYNEVTGLVTTFAAHGFAVDEVAQFSGLKEDQTDAATGYSRLVVAVPSSTTFTVLPKPIGRTFTIGFVKRQSFVYPTIDSLNCEPERAIVRKVGRPFDAFRGRR